MPKRKPKDKDRSPDLPQNWIDRHIERLAAFAFSDAIALVDWDYRRSQYVKPREYKAVDADWGTIRVGERWGGPDTTAFFKKRITIPESHAGANAYLDIDMDGGETQLSINGRLWQGLDFYRSVVPLGEFAVAGNELLLEMEAFIINYPYDERRHDQRDFHTFRKAELLVRDPVVEAAVFDLRFVFEAYLHYWESDEQLEIEGFLLTHLEEACRLLGPTLATKGEAHKAAKKASAYLHKQVYDSDFYHHQGFINICAHSHLDIVYLWPIRETFRKNGRTTTNMLSLLREYPDYLYSQSQPYLYEKLKEYYPAMFAELKSWVEQGRWEVIGALYVEPDGNLIGAESWVRQLLFGKRFIREELGVDTTICWMPDVFGIVYTLPQILKKAGVDYLLTSKLNIWNDTNTFPYDSFNWRGPDGSEILTHFPPTHFAQDVKYSNLRRQWTDYREKQAAAENLFVYGWGDGGGGPTREMVEATLRAKKFPGLPRSQIGSAENFFQSLEKRAARLPIWDDELYLEAHRGTYTSKGDLKRQNRKAELLYREVEILSVLAQQFGGPNIQERLNEGWKLLLLNQFHDTLPGSHVEAAVPDIKQDYEQIFSIAHSIQDELLTFLSQQMAAAGDLLIVNTLAARRALVEATAPATVSGVRLATGESLPVQREGNRIWFSALLPAMGWTTASFEGGETAVSPPCATFQNDLIETEHYQITLGEEGVLAQIYDKKHDRHILTDAGNVFQIFEDDPGRKFGAWDIAYHFESYCYPIVQTKRWELVKNGPLFAAFKSEWRVLNNTIEQEMVVYAENGRIDFHTRLDWQDSKKLLKVAFPLNIRTRTATYDLPFGHIERPTHRNTSWEQAKYEVCGHKWADMSEGDYGVALLNDCKYGYDAHKNVLRLSLVRSPVRPSPKSDIGEHRFSYALYPHAGNWRQANMDKEGYAFNCGALVTAVNGNSSSSQAPALPSRYSLVKMDTQNAIIEAIKQAENRDGFILRAFDSHGTHNQVTFSFPLGKINVSETNLLEENLQPIPSDRQFSTRFSPYEIKTFHIQVVK